MAEDLEDDYDEEPEYESAGSSDQKKRKKLVLVVVLPLLLAIGALAGVYFAGLGDVVNNMFAGDEAPIEQQGSTTPVGAAVFYDLPEMLVDINSQGRKRAFLKLRVSLELSSPSDGRQVEIVMPRIIDNFQVYLRELRLEDLEGAAGIYRLREELLQRVNAAVRPARVNDILFKEMLIQ